jgi:hypothetical protein
LLVIALGLLVVVGAGLVAAGLDLVWTSTAGEYVSGLQPDDPDYVALVTPSPTLLVASVHDDELVGVALLAMRPRDDGGSVITMPAETRANSLEGEDGDPPSGQLDEGPESSADEESDSSDQDEDETGTLADAYGTDGSDGLVGAVERLFRVAVTENIEVNDDGWASLVASVEPLTVAVPDDVGDRWPAGSVELEGDEVGEFLRLRGDEESELNRVARQELFWREWLAAVAEVGDEAVPGEREAGLGRFVDGLRQDLSAVSSVPVVARGAAAEDGGEYFEADADDLAAIVARDIPFPQEPEIGVRTRVSLLNGTTDTDLGLRVTGPLVESGAEIAVTGNAATFSESETLLTYSEATQRQAAVELRDALGIGRVEHRSSSAGPAVVDDGERIDVTVILGADAPEAMRRLETTG